MFQFRKVQLIHAAISDERFDTNVSIPQGPINTRAGESEVRTGKMFQFRKVQLIPEIQLKIRESNMFQFRKVQLIHSNRYCLRQD